MVKLFLVIKEADMKHAIAAVLVGLVVSGCSTHESRIKSYSVTCERYGFTRGTTQFAECLQRAELLYQIGNVNNLVKLPETGEQKPPPPRLHPS
jgi:hypothetical protein